MKRFRRKSYGGIAEQTGAAVAFGAHFSKGNQSGKNAIDRVSGSGVFARDPDTILTLTAHEEPNCFTLDATLRNLPPMESFVLRWQYPLFVRDEGLDPTKLKTVGRPTTHTADNLLAALGDGAMGAMDWMRAAGCSKETYYRLRAVLEQAGKIKQDSQRRWCKA